MAGQRREFLFSFLHVMRIYEEKLAFQHLKTGHLEGDSMGFGNGTRVEIMDFNYSESLVLHPQLEQGI